MVGDIVARKLLGNYKGNVIMFIHILEKFSFENEINLDLHNETQIWTQSCLITSSGNYNMISKEDLALQKMCILQRW